MLLGLAKGKVGDLVFYRDGGEQRTRTRVIPKNPRTPAQMAQRCKIANVSGVYRALQSVLAESFTNRASNQSGYNVFAASAIPMAPYLTKQMAAAGVVLPQPAFAAKGILQSLELPSTFDADAPFGVEVDDAFVEGTTTIAQVSAYLIGKNSALQYGDKISLVSLRFFAAGEEFDGVEVYNLIPEVKSFILSPDDTTTAAGAGFAILEGRLTTSNMQTISEDGIGMMSVIISRVDENGALQTSTERFTLSPSAESLYDGYRTTAAINEAVQSYMAGTESILR